MKFFDGGQSCNNISVVDKCVRGVVDGVFIDDPLKHYLVHSSFRKSSLSDSEVEFSGCDMEDKELECTLALHSLPSENSHEEKLKVTAPVFEDSKSHGKSSSSKNEGLVLKQLGDHLRYAFLGGQSEVPVIIFASLSPTKEEKLIEVLRRHKSSLAWSIADIKGLSLTICMHKILTEESFKPSIKHKWRLNLAMKEVVRGDVLKLLNVGIIYVISDTSWVSTVQVVPKK